MAGILLQGSGIIISFLMLSNRSFYSGYDFSLNFGYRINWQKFNGVARQAYNRTEKVYFVRLIVGLEPIS